MYATHPTPVAISRPTWTPAPASETHETLTPEEFERMTMELSNPLMATALRLTRNRAEAEDLVQETLYRAFRALKSYRKGSYFRAWLFRIQHNVFLNRAKREAKAPAAVDPVNISETTRAPAHVGLRSIDELEKMADRHFDDRVKAALEKVPEVYRVPFVLFSLGELTYQEIADVLEIPVGTVMSRLYRARHNLRGQLADYDAAA